MTAPERRRPLPALAFIAALTVLTAIVWFRVIHRSDGSAAAGPPCSPSSGSSAPPALKVLPVPSKVTIAVLNATEKSGFARSTKKLLTRKGFKVPVATNDTAAYGGHGVIKGVGEIRYGPGSRAAATLLHYYVPGATLVPSDSSSDVVSFALGAKFTTLRTIAQVQTLLQANHVTLTRGALPSDDPSGAGSGSAGSGSAAPCVPTTSGSGSGSPSQSPSQ